MKLLRPALLLEAALAAFGLAAITALSACHSAGDWKVIFHNNTGVPLEYCTVETDPPPPHRECNRVLDVGLNADVDPEDFNPLIWDPGSKLGAIVQMDLGGHPPTVLVRVMQLVVPPGQEGTDPANQPTVISDHFLEPDPDKTKVVKISAGAITDQMPIQLGQP